jgi:excisionase family DNA binding protein
MSHDVDAAYMSSPQAARILGITGVGVAQLVRQGKIPAVKIANRWLIPRAFVEEFARTYEGKRGRPRKKGPSGGCPEVGAGALDAAADMASRGGPADEVAVALTQPAADLTAETAPAEPVRVEPSSAAAPGDAAPMEALPVEAGPVEAVPAEAARADVAPAEVAPDEVAPAEAAPAKVAPGPEAAGVAEGDGEEREGGAGFKVSAEVYHLDRNYDFEVYERGRITDTARIIVARLKPRIPSLPQFSFRWDYRYEHLNVDIHGVEPAAVEWWTMGKNGYTGHLPRRLAGPDCVFEAIIWLPVTFVFRGRLTLSGGSGEGGEPSSVAATTGGLRRLWNRWPGKPHS